MSFRIAIVEDEYFIAEDLKAIIEKSGFEVVGIAANYEEAIVLIVETSPDLVLLDIQLDGEKSGIDLATILYNKYQLPFIFLTSFSDKTTVDKAKDLHPLSYLVKPFNERNVVMAIEIGMANVHQQKPKLYDEIIQQDYFFVKDRRMMKKVRFEEVTHLQSDDNYLYIYTESSRFIIYSSLKDVIEKLPDQFERIHRSFIINIDFVKGLMAEYVVLQNEKELPIGRSYKQDFMKKLNFLTGE